MKSHKLLILLHMIFLPVADFTKKVNPSLAKQPLEIILAEHLLTNKILLQKTWINVLIQNMP